MFGFGIKTITVEQLAESSRLDPNAETLIICKSGHRSATAAKQLKRAGFTDVHSVKGGTGAWRGKLKR